MAENEKKIKMLKEKINQIKRLGDRRNWYNLTDSEKENALNQERRWKDKRITEIMQEIRRLKGK
tara:strand:+ start:7 stop:198 length:192 start_codon:yes stop_codon:yes gene_type:complete